MARRKDFKGRTPAQRAMNKTSTVPTPLPMPVNYEPSSFLLIKRPQLKAILQTPKPDQYHLPVPLPKRRRLSDAVAGPSCLPDSMPITTTPELASAEPESLHSPFSLNEMAASLPRRSVQFKSPVEEATPLHLRKPQAMNTGPSPTVIPHQEPLFLPDSSTEASTQPSALSTPNPSPPPLTQLAPLLPVGTHPRKTLEVPPSTPSPRPTTNRQTTITTSPACETPLSSPMPPFPPTPPLVSGEFGSPKWPIKRPRSLSDNTEAEEEIDELDPQAGDRMQVDRSSPTPSSSREGKCQVKEMSKQGDEMLENWMKKIELMSGDFDVGIRTSRGKGKHKCDKWASLLQGLIEAERLLGLSVDQMRDCLLRFKAAGYPVQNDQA